jgi:hypothetical protein
MEENFRKATRDVIEGTGFEVRHLRNTALCIVDLEVERALVSN